MKQLALMSGFLLLFFSQCKKDGGKGCWQAFSPLGADIFNPPLCDITKKEAEEKYPGYWFYRSGETKYCWKATKSGDPAYPKYVWGIPESMKTNMENAHGYALTKFDCNGFCNLGWAEKHKSKVTGQIIFYRGYNEVLLNADSCSKLFQGRVINLWETADSVAFLELVNRFP
jgi:hypothetical protein